MPKRQNGKRPKRTGQHPITITIVISIITTITITITIFTVALLLLLSVAEAKLRAHLRLVVVGDALAPGGVARGVALFRIISYDSIGIIKYHVM